MRGCYLHPLQHNGYFFVFVYQRNQSFEANPNAYVSGNNLILQCILSIQFAGDLKLHLPPLDSA